MFEQGLGAGVGSATPAAPAAAHPPPGPGLVSALLATPLAERTPAGRIDAIVGWEQVIAWAQARLLADATSVLNEDTARAVVADMLPKAETSTWGQLNARLQKAVLAADSRGAEERHARAAGERRVVLTPEPDGMAWLSLYTTADAAMAGWIAATALATAAKSGDPGDGRGVDARRADALADLFTAALDDPALPTQQRSRPHLQIVVPVGTLLGGPGEVSAAPAVLAGYGPIPASLARRIAADAQWRRILTDPASGTLLDVGTTTYRPPAGLAEFILTRDATCRFPSCRMPARRCDLDHTRRYPDGPTAAHNLGPECEPHHLGKHRGGWTLRQPSPGRFEWTSPTGHVYTVDAEPLGPLQPPPKPPPPPDDEPPPF